MKFIEAYGDLVLAFILSLAALVVSIVPALSASLARPVVGAAIILFVPGYAFIAALFPHKTTLRNGLRLALSFGTSIAIVPLLEMGLNYTRWGIRVGPTLSVIVIFTLACVVVAGTRRSRLPPYERFVVNWQAWKKKSDAQGVAPFATALDRTLSIILVLAIVASVAVASYAIIIPKQGEHFTEFYLLGANGTLGNYTTQYRVGVPSPVTVGIVNNEARNVTYTLVVSANNSTQQHVIYSEQMTVANGQQWEKEIDLVLNQPGDNAKLDFSLYADHTTADPYRDAHLWVNVTA